MNLRLLACVFLWCSLPATNSVAGAGTKSIKIDEHNYSKHHRAVWFDPGYGDVHKVKGKPPQIQRKGAMIWIDPGEATFRLEPKNIDASLSLVGYGDAVFNKSRRAPIGKKTDHLEPKLSLSGKKPVVLIETADSKSLVIIDRLDQGTGALEFRWRPIWSGRANMFPAYPDHATSTDDILYNTGVQLQNKDGSRSPYLPKFVRVKEGKYDLFFLWEMNPFGDSAVFLNVHGYTHTRQGWTRFLNTRFESVHGMSPSIDLKKNRVNIAEIDWADRDSPGEVIYSRRLDTIATR